VGKYILKRIVSLLPVLLVVAVVDFIIIHLTPGDPAAVMLGSQATEEELAKLRDQLGLNLPIYSQFGHWILGVLQRNLGWSIFMDMPVAQAIWEHLGPTVSLTLIVEAIAVLFAIPLGVMAANRRGSWMDQSFMMLIPILTVIGLSFATLIGGTVVTETVFNIPGIGKLIVNSVLRRDYEVIQGAVLLIAAAYVLINLLVDLLYAYIDPRVRYDKS
jgi:ABC-type dipeptide/oligopeptide/nickel transport system permease component